jgi:hypothetical protein
MTDNSITKINHGFIEKQPLQYNLEHIFDWIKNPDV